MKICFIADSSSTHVHRIVAHCVRKKDEVLVISTAPYRAELAGTKTVHLLDSSGSSFGRHGNGHNNNIGFIGFLKSNIPLSTKLLIYYTIRDLRLLYKRELCAAEIQLFDPEVIYCFRCYPEGMLASYRPVRPFLLRTAGPDISKLPKYPVYRQIIRKALQTADVIVTESFHERKLLINLCGPMVDPKVIVLGVDGHLFCPPISQQALRMKYDLPCDAFVVVTNRSLYGHYNGWQILQAIERILDQCPKLTLLYASPSKMDLRTKAKARKISASFPRIKFIEDPVPHSQVPEILGCGDVYISFSSYDGIPNSVLEAMACGVVPVVAELSQLREWIDEGVTGYFVPQRDTRTLASVISGLYKDPERLSRMSGRCALKIKEQGSHEECMERTRALLESLLQKVR